MYIYRVIKIKEESSCFVYLMYIVDINEKFMSKAVQTVKWPQQQNIFYYFVALNMIVEMDGIIDCNSYSGTLSLCTHAFIPIFCEPGK
jgi:hypothetical protein